MIAVDWGSSSLRAFRLDADGRVCGQRRSGQGVLACQDDFAAVLGSSIAGWGDGTVVLSGMVGSRQGWCEVPYVECPATLADIAAGMQRQPAPQLDGRAVWIVPGLAQAPAPPESPAHEVMRGEETQLCGLLPAMGEGRHLVCLAGTHSKLVQVDAGRIRSFSTAMTGELFALLVGHSILGRLMQGDAFDADAFARGVDDARGRGDLLRHLFAVRTHGLFDLVPAQALHSYLSGLLIGHELNDIDADAGAVTLVASPALQTAYVRALQQRGLQAHVVGEEVAAHGAWALARLRGLV